jgi:hypothetical protein
MKAPIFHSVIVLFIAVALAPPLAPGGEALHESAARADSGLTVQPSPVDRKNPELAGAFSVILPGLGHVYAGETVKGGVLGGLFIAGIGAVIGSDIGATHTSIRAGGWASVCFVGAVYLYALIDAPFAARRENARPEESHTHFLRFDSSRTAVTIDLALSARGPGALLVITF